MFSHFPQSVMHDHHLQEKKNGKQRPRMETKTHLNAFPYCKIINAISWLSWLLALVTAFIWSDRLSDHPNSWSLCELSYRFIGSIRWQYHHVKIIVSEPPSCPNPFTKWDALADQTSDWTGVLWNLDREDVIAYGQAALCPLVAKWDHGIETQQHESHLTRWKTQVFRRVN